MLQVSELFVYPIKSLGGIKVSSAFVTNRGLQYDRRWMLVDNTNKFMTQREIPALALFQVSITLEGLQVQHKQNGAVLMIPFHTQTGEEITVQIWEDVCTALPVSPEADSWFSQLLSLSCRLVFMPDASRRPVDEHYAIDNEITSFSDAYPIMIIGQSSLDDLNNRLMTPLPINRFRPSIVFTGGEPFEEDTLERFVINDIHFYGVKLCYRCVVTTISQENGIKGKEPLKTLASYRMKNNKIYFGQNLLHKGEGIIKTGDSLHVKARKASINFSKI
jgi:uncharacterized protein YcbX